MLIYYSIRFESSARTSYLLGHTNWNEGPPGATIINITAWPSQPDPSLYYYNAFVANINNEEQMEMIIRGTQEEDDDYVSIDDSDNDDEHDYGDGEDSGSQEEFAGGDDLEGSDDGGSSEEAKNDKEANVVVAEDFSGEDRGGRKSYAEMTLAGGKERGMDRDEGDVSDDDDDDDSDEDEDGEIDVAASDDDGMTTGTGRMDIAEKSLAGAKTSSSS